MTLFAIAGLSLSIFCFCLSLFILRFGQSKVHHTWAAFNIVVALWGFGTFLVGISKSPDHAALTWRFAYGVGSLVISTFYHFVYTFCELKKRNTLRTIYALAVAFIPINLFAPGFIHEITYIFDGIYYHKATPLFSLFMAYLAVVVFLSFSALTKYLKTAEGNKRTQTLYILFGFGIGWGGGISTFLPPYNIPIYPAWHFTICLYTLLMTYAIFKHQLMDIKIVIKRTLIYSIIITVMTLFYFLSIYLMEHVFQEMFGYRSLLISLGWATIITLTFIPLKNAIQLFVERNLFKNSLVKFIEENQLLRQELIQTEKFKAVATLASGIAHEIRNPLTAILTFNSYLPQKIHDTEFLEKYQSIINKEAHRINNLVQELLTFAKPNPPQIKTVNPNKTIEDLLILIEQQCASHKIAINRNLKTNSTIQADPDQLKQALLNILLNAIDAMPNGGTLAIETTAKHNTLTISITDTGCGIDPKELPHIFEPFYTKKEKGTGLGLAITQGIVEKNNGKITVDSTLNKGTTFKIKIKI